MELKHKVENTCIEKGRLGVFFVGQCGYIFKNPDGKLLALDLYLSDCCEREFGFKRISAKILQPDDLVFDYIIASHEHYDHFDIDSMPALLNNDKTKLLTTPSGQRQGINLNINPDKIVTLIKDTSYSFEFFTLKTVFCDHGELSKDAVGIIIEIEGKKIYFTGDTSFRPDKIKNLNCEGIDVLIAPINGAYGNLNEEQCAEYAKIINPGLTLPCHFWNFPQHGGNPYKFMTEMGKKAPDVRYSFITQGESIII
jgi:L-ascorbate 6-phosphate lactonase